ncbi:MAG: ABC transporter permease [Muribaculaceae bacterium]
MCIENLRKVCNRVAAVFKREISIFSQRPLMLFIIIIVPILCVLYFTSLMNEGLPTNIPTGIVDEDDTHITRIATRIIDSMEETELVHRYGNFSEARKAMQKGEIYGFFYIPKGFTEDAIANRQPKLSFYTNEAYFVAGTLLMKDLRYICELAGLALTRENLYAHGLTEKQAMSVLQPIVIETHPLKNSFLNYSVYLNNIIVPGILILIVMLCTTYSLGMEWKNNRQKELYKLSGCSSVIAVAGKLLPQTLIFMFLFTFMDVYFYKILAFPCNSGLFPMLLLSIATVLSAQSIGVFLFGVFIGKMRLSMCLCSLWGILSFSIAGFTYPITAMDMPLQIISWLFPLRHYYLIYVNQALDGYSIVYVWSSVACMICFILLPLCIMNRYKKAFLKYKYEQ